MGDNLCNKIKDKNARGSIYPNCQKLWYMYRVIPVDILFWILFILPLCLVSILMLVLWDITWSCPVFLIKVTRESVSGVPQGSNQGPLLFYYLLTELKKSTVNCNKILHAHDFELLSQIVSAR